MSDDALRGVDAERVAEVYAAHVPGSKPPLRLSAIPGGHSNLTYRVVDSAGRASVLRRPPLGAVLATAHDMRREHKILVGVARTSVPVPTPLALCEDEGVIGAPFYVMDFVEGIVLDQRSLVERHVPESERRALGCDVVDILARLHAVDVDAVGLGDLGRKDRYLERQWQRWRTQWERSKTRELPAMEQVYSQLSGAIPEQVGSAIVHGDYRLGNMITHAGHRIAAVLDWELCTLGDPLADLGYVLNSWIEPGEEDLVARGGAQSPTSAPGFLSRREVVERYREATGRDTSQIDYYRAFQYWRLAAIVEGVLARYREGAMGARGDLAAFRAQVDALAQASLDSMRSLGA